MNDISNEEMQEVIPVEKKKAGIVVAGVVDKATKTGKKGVELVSVGEKALANGIANGARTFSDKSKMDN